MAFWNDAASEPKRQHRFLIYMDLGQNGFVPYLAKSVTKPGFDVSETEHKFLGNTYYYPGSLTWNDVTCTIINSIDPDGQDLLLAALQKSGYLWPNEQQDALDNRPGTINKADSLDALGEVKIAELDGDGNEVGIWTLKNAFIKSATFGDLDYSGDELLNIEIGMKYDWAAYESKKGGGGTYGGA